MPLEITHQETVPESLAFSRLDHVVSSLFPQYSRSRLQTWIREGDLLVDGKKRRPKDKVLGGERISIQANSVEITFEAQAIPLNIVYEDESLLVINKPAGLVVHPGAGNFDGTLLNGLLHYSEQLFGIPRAGIVHRLDKDTTGLMVVAKTLSSQHHLVQQLQARSVSRIYDAAVYGALSRSGKVDQPIGRHSTQRTKMAVRPTGKPAITHYKVERCFGEHTHIELALETGRTHQIRVHMQSVGHPLIGDNTYGGGFKEPAHKDSDLLRALRGFKRPALHARELKLIHPATDQDMHFHAETPLDMRTLLDDLAQHSGRVGINL